MAAPVQGLPYAIDWDALRNLMREKYTMRYGSVGPRDALRSAQASYYQQQAAAIPVQTATEADYRRALAQEALTRAEDLIPAQAQATRARADYLTAGALGEQARATLLIPAQATETMARAKMAIPMQALGTMTSITSAINQWIHPDVLMGLGDITELFLGGLK